MKTIESEKNQEIKDILSLKKSRNRKLSSTFLIDGRREIEIAISSGVKILKLFISQNNFKNKDINFKNISEHQIVEVSESVFKKISYKENPDGTLAIAEAKKVDLNILPKPKAKESFVILESVEKPGNIGAVIRTAYAANIKTIFITNNQTDIYNPNIIRASEGMIFKLNIVNTNNEDLLNWLKVNEIKIYSAATENSKKYTDVKFDNKSAFIFGSEAKGLNDFWLTNSNKNIKIPMKTGIDSLNISVSAAIILFENLRQKNI